MGWGGSSMGENHMPTQQAGGAKHGPMYHAWVSTALALPAPTPPVGLIHSSSSKHPEHLLLYADGYLTTSQRSRGFINPTPV